MHCQATSESYHQIEAPRFMNEKNTQSKIRLCRPDERI